MGTVRAKLTKKGAEAMGLDPKDTYTIDEADAKSGVAEKDLKSGDFDKEDLNWEVMEDFEKNKRDDKKASGKK